MSGQAGGGGGSIDLTTLINDAGTTSTTKTYSQNKINTLDGLMDTELREFIVSRISLLQAQIDALVAAGGGGDGGDGDPPDDPPTEGDLLVFENAPSDTVLSNGNRTVTGGNTLTNFGHWRTILTSIPIASGDKVYIPFSLSTNVDGGTGGAGLALAGFDGEDNGNGLGKTADSILWRASGIISNDADVTGSIANWNSFGPNVTFESIMLVDRSNPAAQTARVLSKESGALGPAVNITSIFGTADIFFAIHLLAPNIASTVFTQTEVETAGFDAAVASQAATAEVNSFVCLNGPLTGGTVTDPLAPMVFAHPGFTTFNILGGWDQSITQFTANKDLMTHVSADKPDWIEGPGTRVTWLDAVHAAGLKAHTAPGRRFSGTDWGNAVEVNEYSYNSSEVLNHPAMLNGGILNLPDEADLYWNGGAGQAWASPTEMANLVTAWRAGNGGNLSGAPVFQNLLSAGQFYDNSTSSRKLYLSLTDLFASSADQYPRTFTNATDPILMGILGSGSGLQSEFTTGGPGWVTYANKFGPHPSTQTAAVGKPHYEALGMSKGADIGKHLTAAEQDILAWSIVIMGGDGWTLFTTDYSSDAPQSRDQWSPSSTGLPGGMKVWMAKAKSRIELIHSKGVLMRDSAHGGGRSWLRARRSAPAAGPGAGFYNGPTIDSGITWSTPASIQFMPGGWQAVRMWNEAKTVSYFLLQNLELATRTLTLAGDDPWFAYLSGKTLGPGEVQFIDEDGLVVTGWN